jgi:hypothetical protein
MGAPRVAQPFPFFKEAEKNPGCCGCQKSQMSAINPIDANTRTSRTINDFGTHVVESETKNRVENFEHPKPIGDSYYEAPKDIINEFENKPMRYSVK